MLPIEKSELGRYSSTLLRLLSQMDPQEAYYYAVDKTKFQARPFRTQGTYSKYNSIDDKIDDLHYYTTFIKYGLGRSSYDASQEVRNNHLTEEALHL